MFKKIGTFIRQLFCKHHWILVEVVNGEWQTTKNYRCLKCGETGRIQCWK